MRPKTFAFLTAYISEWRCFVSEPEFVSRRERPRNQSLSKRKHINSHDNHDCYVITPQSDNHDNQIINYRIAMLIPITAVTIWTVTRVYQSHDSVVGSILGIGTWFLNLSGKVVGEFSHADLTGSGGICIGISNATAGFSYTQDSLLPTTGAASNYVYAVCLCSISRG